MEVIKNAPPYVEPNIKTRAPKYATSQILASHLRIRKDLSSFQLAFIDVKFTKA